MNPGETLQKTGSFIRQSATFKMMTIGFLVLILLIPTAMISSLMRERQSRRDQVVAEISSKWGNAQTLTGPFLTVPYREQYVDASHRQQERIRYLHILPDRLLVTGKVDTQVRYRSIYEAILYTAHLDVSGVFTVPDFGASEIDPALVLWDKAFFSLGISDMRGIRETVQVDWQGTEHGAEPGLKTTDIAPAGLHTPVRMASQGQDKDKAIPFSLHLVLNGSEQLHWVPMGRETRVELASSWPSPSFDGAFLPDKRSIASSGFSASWRVLHLNRNFPQFWLGNKYKTKDAAFGVSFVLPADIYQKSIRISKYAIMFIVFTFAAFFFSEILNRQRIHPIQYLLVGLAVILFYVLDLALAERIGFDRAYLGAAAAITVLITAYCQGIFKKTRFSLTVAGILVLLYGYLYIVLQLEDYALLMGSIGLFVVLATIMFITRKVDWYNLETE